jgi:transcriptional regulator with XRE-family HTH domain
MPLRVYPRIVHHAAQLLGAEIRAGRTERGWTVAQLAERAGISEKTVRAVEHGGLGVAIGTVFDCAVLVGVPLFYEDEQRLATEAERARAVLGRRVRRTEPSDVDLDF